MSEKQSGVNWNKSSKTKKKRVAVINRLEVQLKLNEKPLEVIAGMQVYTNLTDHDVIRINREIETLKTRI